MPTRTVSVLAQFHSGNGKRYALIGEQSFFSTGYEGTLTQNTHPRALFRRGEIVTTKRVGKEPRALTREPTAEAKRRTAYFAQ